MSNAGSTSIRNDNPKNVVFKQDNMTSLELKEQANAFLKLGFISLAISYYNQALKRDEVDNKLAIVLLSNLSQSYLSLDCYNNSLLYAEMALRIDPNH